MTHVMRDSVARAWLAVVGGGAIAAAVLLYSGWRPGGLPVNAVAQVGEHAIDRADWLRAVAAVEADRDRALDAGERARVLQHLIDEELLLQHALNSRFVRDDPGLRKTIIAALVEASTQGAEPDEAAARALFEQNPEAFGGAPRLRVTALRVRPGLTAPSQQQIAVALRGGPTQAALQLLDLPTTLLPLPQLAQRIGGSLAQTLISAPTDAVIGPLQVAGASTYAMVRERSVDRPRYEDVADAVRAEWSHRQADRALAGLLQSLRTDTPIRIAADARAD